MPIPRSLTCPKCESVLLADDAFCGNCGHSASGDGLNEGWAEAANEKLLEALRHATLGEYEIREELGRGGMAVVYLAHEIALGRKVALKVLAPALQLTPGMPQRFLREAKIAAGLEHQHIVPIYAVKETPGLVHFTMRWVPGRALSTIIRRVGQLPVPLVRGLMAEVGGALAFAHQHGVLHRDVKPSNVLVGRDGSAVVMDFGIAKQTDGPGLTQTGQLLGTPGYMSPEQCRGQDVTAASDQYSLGAMAFEMLAGRLPFDGTNAMDVMSRQISEPVPDLLRLRPDCPRDLARAVVRMLAKDPPGRFPSLDAALVGAGAAPLPPADPLRAQLVKWAEGPARPSGYSVTPVSPTPAMPERRAKPARHGTRPSVAVLVGGSAIVGVAAAVWWALGARPRPAEIPAIEPPGKVIEVVPPIVGPADPVPAPATPVSPGPTTGTLVVARLPRQGTIWLDGARARQPLQLRPGTHRLRLEAPGYASTDREVVVVAGRTDTVTFAGAALPAPKPQVVAQEPPKPPVVAQQPAPAVAPSSTGFLLLRVTPFARVSIDGRFVAEHEMIRVPLAAGTHRLSFSKDGFEARDTTVSVQPGETVRVRVTLRKPQ